MRDLYTFQLEALKKDVVSMAERCAGSLNLVSNAFERKDCSSLDQVSIDYEWVRTQEEKIQNESMMLMLRQQPVATDLWRIGLYQRVSASLERISKLTLDLCHQAGKISCSKLLPELITISKTAAKMTDMIAILLNHEQRMEAHKVVAMDDDADASFRTIRSELTDMGPEASLSSADKVTLLMMAKYCERIGDYDVRIAELFLEFDKHRGPAS